MSLAFFFYDLIIRVSGNLNVTFGYRVDYEVYFRNRCCVHSSFGLRRGVQCSTKALILI